MNILFCYLRLVLRSRDAGYLIYGVVNNVKAKQFHSNVASELRTLSLIFYIIYCHIRFLFKITIICSSSTPTLKYKYGMHIDRISGRLGTVVIYIYIIIIINFSGDMYISVKIICYLFIKMDYKKYYKI